MVSKHALTFLVIIIVFCVSSASYLLLFRPEKSDTDPVIVQYDMIELEKVGFLELTHVQDILVLNDTVWVATWNGLYKLDLDLNVQSHYTVHNTFAGLLHDFTFCLAVDGDDLWVGTYIGISVLNMKNHTWMKYDSFSGLGGPKERNMGPKISSIVVGGDSIWVSVVGPWIAFPSTETGEWIGLNEYNKSYKNWTFYSYLSGHLPHSWIIDDMILDGNNLWLVGNRISYFDTAKKEHFILDGLGHALAIDGEKLWVVSSRNYSALIYDKTTHNISFVGRTYLPHSQQAERNYNILVYKDFVLIPTKSGLLFYNKTAERYTIFDHTYGMPGAVTSDMGSRSMTVYMNDSRLWIGTNTGIYVFNVSVRTITTYDKCTQTNASRDSFLPNLLVFANNGVIPLRSFVGKKVIRNRFHDTIGGTKAAKYIHDALGAYTDKVEYQDFVVDGINGRNVVATLGDTSSTTYYIISAHYDTAWQHGLTIWDNMTQPGADDNACGVAAMIEIARIFSQHRPSATIKFIAFDAEEMGYKGSHYYAQNFSNGHNILGVFNLDMIGYNVNNKVALAHNAYSSIQKSAIESANTAWLKFSIQDVGEFPHTDHAPFGNPAMNIKFPAVSFLEEIVYNDDNTWTLINPHYHTSDDTIEHLDMSFTTGVAALAAISLLREVGV